MADSPHPRPDRPRRGAARQDVRLAGIGDPADARPAADEPEPEPATEERIPPEAPEADTVEQRTDVVDDDTDPAWGPLPEEADTADATDQKRPAGKPDEDEYR